MGKLTKFAKKIIPAPLIEPLRRLYSHIVTYKQRKREVPLIKEAPLMHSKALDKVRSKGEPFNVVFFALMDSVWKYDRLYQLMVQDKRFNAVILVCPIVNYGRENMLNNMEKCYSMFKQKGYNVIRSYDEATDTYVDVRKELAPDLIFYTNPYQGLIDDRYYITQFPDILTLFTTYGFPESKSYSITFDSLFHNVLWRKYVDTEYRKSIAKRYSRVKGSNVIVSGYPGIDNFIRHPENVNDVWPIKDRHVKRIIWAPHHTITGYAFVNYSTFLRYYQTMLDLAHKYKNDIQIAFKPHPLLKNRLKIEWGEEKTHEYYNRWDSLSNGFVADGEYEDLFNTSDAIIHDSGSFIGEYLFTEKPGMFLENGIADREKYNDLAIECLKHYYIGNNEDDIENFIQQVITGDDPLKEDRISFVRQELYPPNGKLASENIMDDLISSLCPTKV